MIDDVGEQFVGGGFRANARFVIAHTGSALALCSNGAVSLSPQRLYLRRL